MTGYFKPWRRTIGVVTLVMACLFAGGWLRSLIVTDSILIPTGDPSADADTTDAFWSSNSSIVWGKFLESVWDEDGDSRSISFESNRHHGSNGLGISPFFRDDDTQWQWNWGGFKIGSSRTTQMTSIWVVPYWSIVFPLIAFSAWSLLNKTPAAKRPSVPGEIMIGYFKPWRRNVGVAMLFMACVLAAGWVRSQIVADRITLRIDERTFDVFASCPIGTIWSRNRYRVLTLPASMPEISWTVESDLSHWKSPEIPTTPFGFRVIGDGDPQSVTFVVRYYTLVIPVTLVAAWLLLSRPSTKVKPSILAKGENP